MPAILKDLSSGQAYSLEDFTLIGRGEGASLQLADTGVSRQHASIRREERDYWLLDLGSANGSFINGVELTGARVLRHGDRLQLGNSMLVFLDGGAAAGPAAADDERTRISLSSQSATCMMIVTRVPIRACSAPASSPSSVRPRVRWKASATGGAS